MLQVPDLKTTHIHIFNTGKLQEMLYCAVWTCEYSN